MQVYDETNKLILQSAQDSTWHIIKLIKILAELLLSKNCGISMGKGKRRKDNSIQQKTCMCKSPEKDTLEK